MSISVEIHDLLITTMKADAPLMAMVNGVWDKAPSGDTVWATPKKSYVDLGATDISDDSAECIDGEIHAAQIDVWSRTVGTYHCKEIVDRIRKLFKGASLQLTENALVDINVTLARVFDDPDPLTTHGVVTVELTVEVS